MKHALIVTALMFMAAGCSTKNPVSAGSGTLQYVLTTARRSYIPGDTLHFMLSVQNTGSATDTVAVGDAILVTWSLKNTSGAVMYSGQAPTGGMIGFLPVPPGDSKGIDSWTHALTDSSGNVLPAGSYTFTVDYGSHLAAVALSVQ